MSSPHKAFEEAHERHEQLRKGHDFVVPLAAAIIAVLAALGTLFAHHRSISALAAKNEAILAQSKASDQYTYYQAKRIKYTIYAALLSADVAKDAKGRAELASVADHEQKSSLVILADAKRLEHESETKQASSERTLTSFETLEIATTLFEIAIVFVSISALGGARILLYIGGAMSVVGVVYAIVGLLQPH